MSSLLKKPESAWTIRDSDRLYRISRWGSGYYHVNDEGHVSVRPTRNKRAQVDLYDLMKDLRKRKIEPPVLIRFMDVLSDRIRQLSRCFHKASTEYKFAGAYRPVYPIKVNQQCQVVGAMVEQGKKAGLGLEVGSKPELLAVLALSGQNSDLIICNGYKDDEYIETALYGQRLGKTVILVVEKFSELKRITRLARELDIEPTLGVRIKLAGRGEGRWADTVGDLSKFGLRVPEVFEVIDYLRREKMLEHLKLVHFHIGSQITRIDRVKSAMNEVARMYAELRKIGVGIDYVDVGGGLGVDYEGGHSTSSSGLFTVNYSMQEYANDIVFALQQICSENDLPHPTIITESGRALTAHYSVLVTNVIDQSHPLEFGTPAPIESKRPQLKEMQDLYTELNERNCRENFHDAVHIRKSSLDLFNYGYYSLEERAYLEAVFWSILKRIDELRQEYSLDYSEFDSLDQLLASTYFVNFSLFQSLPDSWAIDQLFPIAPIHRLDEKPTERAVLADITCDSDGKVDAFSCAESGGKLLPVHKLTSGKPYYMGFFLVGAYQEILGDLHNLFGDTHAVHIALDKNGQYKVDQVIKGDTVKEVLDYLEYHSDDLVTQMRRTVERSVAANGITVEESAAFMRLFEAGLAGYTYLED